MAIQGDLDIASCANAVLANYIPEMSILDQAFLWDSQDQANYAVRNELGDLIQEKANAQGIHVIGYMESGFRDVFSKKPIQTMADFNGVKIRTMQNDGQLLAFTSFGANPVALAAGDQFTALQQNTIDACENAVSNCWVNKFYEAGVTSVTKTHHCFVYIPLCMSDNAWNKIPDDMKDTFVEACLGWLREAVAVPERGQRRGHRPAGRRGRHHVRHRHRRAEGCLRGQEGFLRRDLRRDLAGRCGCRQGSSGLIRKTQQKQ